ncbi:retrovirus-related pol polyprotein from transposon TNT 1-94 [Tanacetum coccineum]
MVEVKVLMELAEENDAISKEGAINEQRNNLLSKHRDLVHELNACKEQLLVLKQAKLDFLTMQHVNTKILKENKNLRIELKELTVITETWLNSSNKVMTQKCPYLVLKDPGCLKLKVFILPNHDTGRILPAESQRNTIDPSVVVTDSSAPEYDSADESSVCSTPLPLLKKLDGVEPISRSKTIKSILRSKSTFKAESLKGVTINEPSSALAKGNKSSLASKVNSAPAGKLKSVKIEDDPILAICERTDYRTYDHLEYISTKNMSQHLNSLVRSSSRPKNPRPSKNFFPSFIHCGFSDYLSNDYVNYPICDICGSYDHDTHGNNRIISLRRGIKPRNPQHVMKSYETCGSTFHTTTDHNDIEWFRRDLRLSLEGGFLGKTNHSERICSVTSGYPFGPKVVFGDDSTYIIEGYGSIKCNGIVFTKVAFVNGLKYNLNSISQLCDAKYVVQFDEKRGTIFNSNKEFVMIAPRVRDVYVLDMASSAQESCFFAEASENLNWLWHKTLAHLNFKTNNKLAKQNLVIGLPSLIYSKDKPCSSCEKEKHHRENFKTKQTSSIKKCLHLLHIDLFEPVTPRSINHEKYTLVIVDEYSRNSILFNFCDEKGISQNFSSPYTPEQNGVTERKNRTLIEAARTMLSGSIFSKQYWTEALATACYTQNRSTIVKRHLKTPYEIFRKRIPNINFLHVFGCPVYIHNHKDHLGKFDEKADDGYLLGYSLVSKAFRVFNTRRQQTEETYHITFDESPDAIKFSKPSVDNINIAENKRYPPDEYLHACEPSQRYQTNSNDMSFIEPYECLEPIVLETEVSSDQNGQTNQNDQSIQNDEIFNNDHSEHSNHTNDEQIIDNLTNTKDIQISEHSSSPREEDTSVQNTIPISNPPLPIPPVATPAPQDIWSQDKYIDLVNIIGNLGSRMLTRAMAKELGAASAHECLFVDFLFEEEPKKVSDALQHPGWVDAMQYELNQFARAKVWTLVPAPYGKTIIGSKWVFRNKRDETGIVIKNKARLVA